MQKLVTRRQFFEIAAVAAGTAAAASVSASPTKSAPSAKKGFGCGTADAKAWDLLRSLRVQWFYNWNSAIPEGKPDGIQFMPMIWGGGKGIEQTCRKLKEQGHKTVMGFNEPDQHDQSNITVDKAIELWPQLMESGLRLGSPGCVHPDREWMKEFMAKAKARKYRVDFVTMHWYWEPDPNGFLSKVESVHKLFGLPIWITEFAVADWNAGPGKPNRFAPQRVEQFMEKALAGLEKTGYVERYSWFSAKEDNAQLGTSALFHKDNSLTTLGKVYASL